jgi:hypothetical protein
MWVLRSHFGSSMDLLDEIPGLACAGHDDGTGPWGPQGPPPPEQVVDRGQKRPLADMDRPPPIRVRFEKQSATLMLHVRNAKSKKALHEREEALVAKKQALENSMQKLATYCPDVARCVGLPVKRMPKQLDLDRAELLVRATFSDRMTGSGIRPERAKCFAADLIKELQAKVFRG